MKTAMKRPKTGRAYDILIKKNAHGAEQEACDVKMGPHMGKMGQKWQTWFFEKSPRIAKNAYVYAYAYAYMMSCSVIAHRRWD